MRKLTDEQKAILENDVKEGVLCVSAFAGCGKTSTLVEWAKRRPKEKILYMAFNKAMATEAERKFAQFPNVKAKTIHSLAFGKCGYRHQKVLGNLRPEEVAGCLGGRGDVCQSAFYLRVLNDFMGSAAQSMEDFLDVREDDSLLQESLEGLSMRKSTFAKNMGKLWKAASTGKITMPHNAYLKLYQMEGHEIDADVIMIDEAQDVTDCMIDIVMKQKGKKIFIGDPYQQIYGFNGATNALEKIARQGGETAYLTRSFRCPKGAAELANAYLRFLGSEVDFKGRECPVEKTGKNAVIARSNAKIFEAAYMAHDAGEPFGFLGGFEGYRFGILIDLTNLYLGKRATDPFLSRFDSFSQLEDYAGAVDDKELLSRINIVKTYESRVYEMYYDVKGAQVPCAEADVVLTTGHKAKGQEFDSVLVMDDFVDVDEMGRRHYDAPLFLSREEFNVLYVAMTRTKEQLEMPQTFALTEERESRLRRLMDMGKIHLVTNNRQMDAEAYVRRMRKQEKKLVIKIRSKKTGRDRVIEKVKKPVVAA